MYLVKTFVADKDKYLLPANEYFKTDPNKTLLGYYDKEYIYHFPSVLIGLCDDYLIKVGKSHINMQNVLNTLFRARVSLQRAGQEFHRDRDRRGILQNRKRKDRVTMDAKEFTRELAERKGISEQTAYRYINSVMDTIRQLLAEGVEVKICSFGKFTVVTDLEGNKTAMLCSAKSLKQAITAGEGIV